MKVSIELSVVESTCKEQTKLSNQQLANLLATQLLIQCNTIIYILIYDILSKYNWLSAKEQLFRLADRQEGQHFQQFETMHIQHFCPSQ